MRLGRTSDQERQKLLRNIGILYQQGALWSSLTLAENIGLPLNSSADDYGYTRNRSGYGGFFVSNRVFGGQKTNTRHYDVFEFTIGGRQIVLKGKVYDAVSSDMLDDVKVSLY